MNLDTELLKSAIEQNTGFTTIEELYCQILKYKITQQCIELRKQNKLSQRQLSQRLQIYQPQLARFESGKHFSLDMVMKILNELGYEIQIEFKKIKD